MNLIKGKKASAQPAGTEPVKTSTAGSFSEGWGNVKKVIGKIVMVIYHLRKIFLAAPVAFVALRLAAYNMTHLPEQVGVNLQTTGEFAMQISRYTAVIGPLAVTAGCLVMMFFSRKAMYAWAISIFTLVLPVLLLISNIYPA